MRWLDRLGDYLDQPSTERDWMRLLWSLHGLMCGGLTVATVLLFVDGAWLPGTVLGVFGALIVAFLTWMLLRTAKGGSASDAGR